MPIKRPDLGKPPVASPGGDAGNREQVNRGNFNNATVTVAGQDASANEADQHLQPERQPSPIPPPRSKRNVKQGSGTARFLPPGASNVPSGASNIPPGASNVPSGASNIPPGASNVLPESLYAANTNVLTSSTPQPSESLYAANTNILTSSTPQPSESLYAANTNILTSSTPQPSESLYAANTNVLTSSTPQPSESLYAANTNVLSPSPPPGPRTLEASGQRPILLDSTSHEYAEVLLPQIEQLDISESGARNIRQTYTTLVKEFNKLVIESGNYMEELASDMILVDNATEQPSTQQSAPHKKHSLRELLTGVAVEDNETEQSSAQQSASRETHNTSIAKAVIRDGMHDMCMASIIKECQNIQVRLRALQGRGDETMRASLTSRKHIDSKIAEIDNMITHVDGRRQNLHVLASRLQGYNKGDQQAEESALDALPLYLLEGEEMKQDVSSTVREAERIIAMINPNRDIPKNIRSALPILKMRLKVCKTAIAAYRQNNRDIKAKIDRTTADPRNPRPTTSKIYYRAKYDSIITSFHEAEPNIDRLLGEIEKHLPPS